MISYIIPALIVLLLVYALFKRTNIFTAFIDGAADSLPLLKTILPCLATMLIAISVFRSSGALDYLISLLSPVFSPLGLDPKLLPLILLRPFSGSAAVAITTDLMAAEGADSLVGYTAGVLMGASETIFYTLALYFGSIGIKKTRFTLPVALIASLIAVITGIWFSKLLFPF
ncbi:MAG: nucleoside recognition domain-containing protein [Clostridia bacterium]|nr:nucleoside recognition domain-containing protein [Clostridia bacterium]